MSCRRRQRCRCPSLAHDSGLAGGRRLGVRAVARPLDQYDEQPAIVPPELVRVGEGSDVGDKYFPTQAWDQWKPMSTPASTRSGGRRTHTGPAANCETGSLATPRSRSGSTSANDHADAFIAIATVVLIILLLGAIFHSPPISLLPIVVVGVVHPAAVGLTADLAAAFGYQGSNSFAPIASRWPRS